jgi:hypothetical protein
VPRRFQLLFGSSSALVAQFRDVAGGGTVRIVVEIHLGVEAMTSPAPVTTSGLISTRLVGLDEGPVQAEHEPPQLLDLLAFQFRAP